MKSFLTFSLIFFSLFTFSQSKKETIDERLLGMDAELQKVLETWKAPGFAVAVIEKNKIVYAKGFGYRDYENKIHYVGFLKSEFTKL